MTGPSDHVYDEVQAHDLTAAAGETVAKVKIDWREYVGWQIDGDGDTADYRVDVSNDDSTWYEGIESYGGTDRVDDSLQVPEARYVRIVRTSSEASGTANVLLGAKA